MHQQPTPDSDGSSSESTATQLSDLPPPLLVRALQLLPQHHRLSSSALVCSAWHAAAAQATTQINCNLSLYIPGATVESVQARAVAFAAWLEQHGRRVESLEVCGSNCVSPSIPWDCLSQLQSLDLSCISILLSAGSSSGVTAAGSAEQVGGSSMHSASNTPMLLLPRLKQLRFLGCTFSSADTLVQLFSSSTGLTSLKFQSGNAIGTSEEKYDQTRLALCTLLQRLPRLVVLGLPFLPRQAVQHVANMHSLQDLQLTVDGWDGEEGVPDSRLESLPLSLTSLHLLQAWPRPMSASLPSLVQMTSLRRLILHSMPLLPAVLATAPQLQHLELHDCMLLPREPSNTQWGETGQTTSSLPGATTALLSSLQQLTKLQHLCLEGLQLDNEGTPVELWSALTASTQLTYLGLCPLKGPPLPQAAAQHMFPAGRRLPQLQVLSLRNSCSKQSGWCLDGQDLHSLVSCCPRLQKLALNSVVREGADLSVLAQLPASLSSLAIGGHAFGDAAIPALQHTQLATLTWRHSPALSPAALEQLTALQRVSELYVQCGGDAMASFRKAGSHVNVYNNILWLRSAEAKGPVWKQLQAVCERARVQQEEEQEQQQQQA